jgi:hypothetical protein
MMLWAAIIIDFIPDAQTLFTVVVGVVIGKPRVKKNLKLINFIYTEVERPFLYMYSQNSSWNVTSKMLCL